MSRQTSALILLMALGLGSRAATGETKKTEKKEGRSRYALLIGVDDYAKVEPLKYCGADMQALAQQLIAAGFPENHVYLLHDKAEKSKRRPLKVNIEDHLKLVLGAVEEEDLLVVGFSGHGVHLDGKSYLCPTEAQLDDPKTLVSLEGIYTQLEKCPAAMKVLLVDACRNDPRLGGQKSLTPTKQTKQFAASLDRPPQGIVLLTSCAPGEISMEEKDFGHGVFMHFVLEGLQGAADANRDGKVSLIELYLYANDKTKNYVVDKYSGWQRPALKGDIHDDFNISQVASVAPSPTGAKITTNSIGMKLSLIPAGEFMMGATDSEKDAKKDEKPQHRVRITKPFYLGVYEVTQDEYQRVVGSNPSFFSATHDGKDRVAGQDTSRFPVETVSYGEAIEFCRKLSQKEGATYRLPTEAEWEYACRAGTTTPFNFGSALNGRQANCKGNDPYGTDEKGPSLDRTTTVGSYPPNAFGLYDMHGNVGELCADWYDGGYYKQSPTDDPVGASSGSARVLRGGSWDDYATTCRAAIRVPPLRIYDHAFLVLCGFRVVCER